MNMIQTFGLVVKPIITKGKACGIPCLPSSYSAMFSACETRIPAFAYPQNKQHPKEEKMSIVQFEDVSKIYTSGDHELRALDRVSFSLDAGKFVVILGPSGAGNH